MKRLTASVCAAALLFIATSASAQTSDGIGIRAVVSFGAQQMTASDTFDAVVDKTSLVYFGGGVQITNLWQSLFVEVTAERMKADGQRVFVHDGEVFPLDIPLDVSMVPLDVVAGWRFAGLGRIIPYGGAGLTSVSYKETASFDDGDEVSERGTGFVALGGVEVPVGRWIHVRGELRFRHVPGVLGDGGVSAAFDETSLGGFSYGVKVAIGR